VKENGSKEEKSSKEEKIIFPIILKNSEFEKKCVYDAFHVFCPEHLLCKEEKGSKEKKIIFLYVFLSRAFLL